MDATATSTARPLYKVAIQGGQPIFRFNGSTTNLQATLQQVSPATIISIVSLAASANPGRIYDSGNGTNSLQVAYDNTPGTWTTKDSGYQGGISGLTWNAPSLSTFYTLSTVFTGSDTLRWQNGVTQTSSAFNVIGAATHTGTVLGARGDLIFVAFLNGDMGPIVNWGSVISDSLRKRYEQSIGFQYRIPTS